MFIFSAFNSVTVRVGILSRSLAISEMKFFLDLGLGYNPWDNCGPRYNLTTDTLD